MYFHILRDENRRQTIVTFLKPMCQSSESNARNKNISLWPLGGHQCLVFIPPSSLYLIPALLPGPYTEAHAKTNDASRTRAARETAKNWRRGEKLKNVCARHLVLGPPLCLLVDFPSAADAVVVAVAGNDRRLPQQPAAAATS